MHGLRAVYDAMLCPVCGYQLDFKPWNDVSASDEICPCCGIQFGYYDAGPDDRMQIYREWRIRWRAQGGKWQSCNPCPDDFDPEGQLKRLAHFEVGPA